MATEGTIALDEPTTIDKRLDTVTVIQAVSLLTVHRQLHVIAGAEAYAEIARVLNADPASTDYGLVVRTVRGISTALPVFTDPIDRPLRDMGKVDIAAFDAALPAGANNIGDVDVVSLPTSSTTTAPAQSAVGTVAGQLLASNASRKRAMMQNTGTTVIKIALGATDPTQTAYHVALAPGAATDDGKGGVYIDEMWTGRIAAISSAAGGTVVVTELT